MNKKYYVFALLICLLLLVSACKKTGAASGSAPRTPFIGGTAGITMNFEKDSPPPEVTDDGTFAFNAIVRLKNDGEFKLVKDNVKLNLVGFDPADFGKSFSDVSEVMPDDDLEPRRRGAEGDVIEGTTTFVTFPKSGDFVPEKFSGNTEFSVRADICYNYHTDANARLCVLRDMINVRDDAICDPTGSRQIFSSSAPVEVTNFHQDVVGKDKINFRFDVVLRSNVDIFFDSSAEKPSTFDAGCPRDPRARRENENNVLIEITEIPGDPIFSNLKCGGLDGSAKGLVRLIDGKRTIICTVDLATSRNDLEKVVGIKVDYNVRDEKATKVLVKHFATS